MFKVTSKTITRQSVKMSTCSDVTVVGMDCGRRQASEVQHHLAVTTRSSGGANVRLVMGHYLRRLGQRQAAAADLAVQSVPLTTPNTAHHRDQRYHQLEQHHEQQLAGPRTNNSFPLTERTATSRRYDVISTEFCESTMKSVQY